MPPSTELQDLTPLAKMASSAAQMPNTKNVTAPPTENRDRFHSDLYLAITEVWGRLQPARRPPVRSAGVSDFHGLFTLS